ncbi:hypothetical protein EB796_005388 [Bugula neritina]|uniref:Uncharacterized protein n=1 Tax=Bugula neritina TaxID=10212 RepID=A0A7J7KCC2_BUGNE|nr:hypothetical protein EB796_005388 [Bugula neritina]
MNNNMLAVLDNYVTLPHTVEEALMGAKSGTKSRISYDEKFEKSSTSNEIVETESFTTSTVTTADTRKALAPDGGWGWVISVATCLLCFIAEGTGYSFGVFLEYYTESFDTTPLVGALVNKYGCRPVCITGSLITSTAFVLCTLSPSILVFQIVYGIAGGLGICMMCLPAVLSIGIYFDKKRGVAMAIGVGGVGVGVFALAPFSRYLIQEYGWRGAHYIIAGLLLQNCVLGSLLRPLDPTPSTSVDELSGKFGSQCQGSNEMENDTNKDRLVKPNNRLEIKSALELTDRTQSNLQPHRLHSSSQVYSQLPQISPKPVKRPMYQKDIFYSGNITNLQADDDYDYSNSTDHEIPQKVGRRLRCLQLFPKPVADILREMTDPVVLRNKSMLMLCAVCVFYPLGYYMPVLFSASRATNHGVDEDQAALLISILGICNTIGRFLFGFVILSPYLSALLVNNICMAITSFSVLLTPFCVTFPQMAAASAAYGLFSATFMSLTPIIICDFVGVNKLTNGLGIIYMVRGIFSAVGSPIGGQLYDLTGNYDITFYVGGACMLLGCSLSLLLHLKCFHSTIT